MRFGAHVRRKALRIALMHVLAYWIATDLFGYQGSHAIIRRENHTQADGALAVVAASFFITLQVLRYWTQPDTDSVGRPLQEPPYSVAALPRLRPGQSLNFSSGQNRNALLAGWSGSELSGVWSVGRSAFVGFVAEGGAGQGTPKGVVVRANVFLGPTREQRVQVWSGTKQLADPSAELAIPLGGINIGNGAPIILGFYLPDSISLAKAHGGADRRDLALFIISLQLMP
jgi:hypothetical protein